ncbi:MAG: DUF167 domain-containing protein [bacterium]|nr:DUF167 domain-containing protein [bacterium]
MSSVLRLSVTVTPNAKRSEVVARDGTNWKIRVAAKPVEGAANTAVIALVAETLDVPKSMVVIVRGLRGRKKLVSVWQP